MCTGLVRKELTMLPRMPKPVDEGYWQRCDLDFRTTSMHPSVAAMAPAPCRVPGSLLSMLNISRRSLFVQCPSDSVISGRVRVVPGLATGIGRYCCTSMADARFHAYSR
ncbi:hypothetical protein CERZMDRAFT_85733 [Cercospora zeae-maydis SCOH1-5]|uniref:Uncharacterized protein n=1 Tax=Cercospora zeae-maydis SCOH1-5 TaxID=717836 RepID=A0A6A6FCQ2_9PEZI|nr:hypothetical protein CERZMDRAFT_85733 [Cercospora zeae-maydis SCOH1-5]